ncbi:MAG: amidohydrolase family protein [Eggerthellaceae bacterium]|nr:amidohydrolase family protein [Eggerthellaceae bacterium]
MPIVDAHAHIYPEKIASKAVEAVGRFYGVEASMAGKGSSADLLTHCKTAGITHFIVHSVATTAKSVPTINSFLAAENSAHPEFIGFGTMHHEFEDMEAEVDRALSLGLHGFKLHPDTQQVNMDDPRLMNFYEIIAGRVPLVVHTGDYRYDYSSPRRLARIMKTFPDLVVNAAHLSGWATYDIGYDIMVEEGLVHAERLFVDASSSFAWIGRRHMRELIRMWGADRVMYGSDYPMWDPTYELNEMLHCELTDDELEKVLWRNAEAFSGVKVS